MPPAGGINWLVAVQVDTADQIEEHFACCGVHCMKLNCDLDDVLAKETLMRVKHAVD